MNRTTARFWGFGHIKTLSKQKDKETSADLTILEGVLKFNEFQTEKALLGSQYQEVRRALMNQTDHKTRTSRGWPNGAKQLVTVLSLGHLGAIIAGAFAPPPSSPLQQQIADQFRGYHRLVDQGYSYRFYTNGAPPTPILYATIDFGSEQPSETIRIPDRTTHRPRLRFQRHLAIAYHVTLDSQAAPRDDQGNSQSRWAQSVARYLCQSHPGCESVTLFVQDHRNPSPGELVEAATNGQSIDVDDPRFDGPRRQIGVYRCDD